MSPHCRHAELVSASTLQPEPPVQVAEWTLKQVQGDSSKFAVEAQKLLGISLKGSVG